MAVWFNVISPPASPPASVTVTGIPFEPVAVIFFGTRNPGTIVHQMFGCTSGSGEEWAMWGEIRQETGPYNGRHRELRDDCCINIYDVSGTAVQAKGSLTSLNSDGFTVAFTGTGTTQPVFYMAIGGKNISAAHAGTFTTTTSTGPVSETGVGFTPKALIVGHNIDTSLNSKEGGFVWGLGFTDGVRQFSTMVHAPQAGATTADHIQRTDAVACSYIPANGTYLLEIDSMDSDGFTVDVVDAWPSSIEHGYLAIDAAAAYVGTDEFPDSTGVVAYATPGMEPGGVLFAWNGADTAASSGSSTGPFRTGVGGMDGVTVGPKGPHGSVSAVHRASAPFGSYQPVQEWSDAGSVHITSEGSQVDPGAFTLFSRGEFESFDMGEFELDWTTATSNTREFGWLALPGEIPAMWIPTIYRRQP